MKLAENPVASTESAVRRAVGYTLLAHCFAYPDEPRVAAMQEAALAAAPLLGGTPLSVIASLAAGATSGQLEPAYVGMFTMSSSPDCPAFETAYIDNEAGRQTERMADIAGFYRAFGVDASAGGVRPDDICVELEFMGYLNRKQVYAAEHLGAPRVAQVLRAQRIFLQDHLGCWAGALGRRLVTHAGGAGFYARLGVAIEDWVDADLKDHAATPVHVVDGPLPVQPVNPAIAAANEVISLDDIPVL
jgi:TorA maturation chaperone TorD